MDQLSNSPLKAFEITIHDNFSELSCCADYCCKLCAFIRREICFNRAWTTNGYSISEDVIGMDEDPVTVKHIDIAALEAEIEDVNISSGHAEDEDNTEDSSIWLRDKDNEDRNEDKITHEIENEGIEDEDTSKITHNSEHDTEKVFTLEGGNDWVVNYSGNMILTEGRTCAYSKRLPEANTKSELQLRGEVSTLERHLLLAHQWLQTCGIEHNCGPSSETKGFLPRRLLEIPQSEEAPLKLVFSKDIPGPEVPEYLTLSYCWGKSNLAACTTQENIAERQHAIALSSLPQTIQDAVTITRYFGLRYLWVDALCIIQVKEGINKDWEAEVPLIGKIYQNSLFTIAASASRESSDGFLTFREAASWPIEDYEFSTNEGTKSFRMQPSPPSWSASVEHSPLSRRGWVLQERAVSSRTLFFTREGVFWECGKTRRSRYGTVPGSYEDNDCARFDERHLPNLREIVEIFNNPDVDGGDRRRQWSLLLEESSRMNLTVMTDRLPALTGLGKEISRLTGTQFEMGIFKHNIIQDLAWMRSYDSLTLPTLRIPSVPSWSWASIDGPIWFPHNYEHDHSLGELSADISGDGKRLLVHGKLIEAICTDVNARGEITLDYCNTVLAHPADAGVLDTPDDASLLEGGECAVTCLQWIFREIRSEYRWNVPAPFAMGALILLPVDEESNTYRRIGWTLLDVDDDVWADREYADISII
jgi:hypothetical protein